LAYDARTQDDLAKWWATGTGSTVNRLSEVMDDMPDGPAIYHIDADDAWTQNGATAEWYVATATKPDDVAENLAGWRKMTGVADDSETGDGAGLNADEWCYDTDNNRVYIRLSDDSDPNDTDVRKHYAWDGSGAGPAIMTEYIEDLVYRIHLWLEVGDGTTSTTLTSTNELIVIEDPDADIDFVAANASFQVGKWDATAGHAKNGSFIYFSKVCTATRWYNVKGALKLYGSILRALKDGATSHIYLFSTGNNAYIDNRECHFTGFRAIRLAGGGVPNNNYIYNSVVDDGYGWYISCIPTNDFQGVYTTNGIRFSCNANATVKELDADEWYLNGVGKTLILINPISINTSPYIEDDGSEIYVKYSCNIHTADKNGAALASASVACEYAHLVEGSDSKTYKCIADHTAVDADHKPITGTDWADYWVLYNADGGLGGDWNTGFAYKSGTAEFATQTTDANGDMTEQNIQYKKWVGTSEVLEARIHKFTFSKAGYETLPMEDIIVSAAIGKGKPWPLALQPNIKIDVDTNEMFIPAAVGQQFLTRI